MALDPVDDTFLLCNGLTLCPADERDVQEDYPTKESQEIGYTATSTDWADGISSHQVSPHGDTLQAYFDVIYRADRWLPQPVYRIHLFRSIWPLRCLSYRFRGRLPFLNWESRTTMAWCACGYHARHYNSHRHRSIFLPKAVRTELKRGPTRNRSAGASTVCCYAG